VLQNAYLPPEMFIKFLWIFEDTGQEEFANECQYLILDLIHILGRKILLENSPRVLPLLTILHQAKILVSFYPGLKRSYFSGRPHPINTYTS
jgi:hypothetical protein